MITNGHRIPALYNALHQSNPDVREDNERLKRGLILKAREEFRLTGNVNMGLACQIGHLSHVIERKRGRNG